jgi:hypothetical protein
MSGRRDVITAAAAFFERTHSPDQVWVAFRDAVIAVPA